MTLFYFNLITSIRLNLCYQENCWHCLDILYFFKCNKSPNLEIKLGISRSP